MRAIAGALLLAWLSAISSRAGAQGVDARGADLRGIDACEASARAVLEGRGARVVASARAFLFERDSFVVEHRREHAGCLSFLAFGGAGVRDVDLLVHTTAGEVVEEDVEPRSWGWVHACGEAGAELAIVAHAFVGRGEVRVLTVEGGPDEAPALGRIVGGCFAGSAGRGLPLVDAGEPPEAAVRQREVASAAPAPFEPAPFEPALADQRAAIESVDVLAAFAARGMAPRAVAWGLADGLRPHALVVSVPEGCVALAVLRSAELDRGHLDLRVLDARGHLVAWDDGRASVAREPIPIAWSCGSARDLRVEVRAIEGAGRFLLVLGVPAEAR